MRVASSSTTRTLVCECAGNLCNERHITELIGYGKQSHMDIPPKPPYEQHLTNASNIETNMKCYKMTGRALDNYWLWDEEIEDCSSSRSECNPASITTIKLHHYYMCYCANIAYFNKA